MRTVFNILNLAGIVAVLSLLGGCSGGPVLQTPDSVGPPSQRKPLRNTSQQPEIADDSSVSTGKASFSQRGGKFYHPDHQAGVSSGSLSVDVGVETISLVTRGMTTNSSQNSVKDAIRNSAGTVSFERVLSRKLPAQPQFRDHPYLIFAKSATNKKNQKFSITEGQAFPTYASADGDAATYANLSRGPVSYPVNFVSPQSFTATFTVSRATSGALNFSGTGCEAFSSISSKLSDQKSFYGIKVEVSGVPDSLINDFPVPSSIYVIRLSNGGTISQIGSCSGFLDKERGKRGYTAMEFER